MMDIDGAAKPHMQAYETPPEASSQTVATSPHGTRSARVLSSKRNFSHAVAVQSNKIPLRQTENMASSSPWEHDPRNPQCWSKYKKWLITILLSLFTFNAMMTSTMVAPALSKVAEDLGIRSESVTQLIMSIYVLSYAFGFFVWAPLSELCGRVPVLQIASTWFFVWDLVCGFATNKSILAVSRLLAGMGAAAALAITLGLNADVWRREERGRSLAVASMVPLLGPCIGPIVGATIASQSSSAWRWVFWGTAAFNLHLQALAAFFLPETHGPTIRRRLNQNPQARVVNVHPFDILQALGPILVRPFYLLITQPVIQLLCAFTGLAFGGLYIVLAEYSSAFQLTYSQSLAISSLNYLALGLGFTVGAQVCSPAIDKLHQRHMKQHQAKLAVTMADDLPKTRPALVDPPIELRLLPFIPSVVLIAAGLLIFGWTLHPHVHWIVPNVGICIFAMGNQAMTQCTNAYLCDAFLGIRPRETKKLTENVVSPASSQLSRSSSTSGSTILNDSNDPATSSSTTVQEPPKDEVPVNWSASASAGIWAFKSLGGFVFPLFSKQMIHSLGWGFSCTVLALLTLLLGAFVGAVLLLRGERLRQAGRAKIESGTWF